MIEESKLNFYNKLNTFSDKHFLNALSDLKQESHKLTINFPDQKKAIDQLLLEMKECFNSLIVNHYIDIENIKGIKIKIDQQIEDLKTFF